MTTEVYQFPTREMRDLAFETEKARGSKGVTKSTDQIQGKMVYILSVPVPVSPQTRDVEKSNSENTIAQNATLDLRTQPESDMVSEGGPNV